MGSCYSLQPEKGSILQLHLNVNKIKHPTAPLSLFQAFDPSSINSLTGNQTNLQFSSADDLVKSIELSYVEKLNGDNEEILPNDPLTKLDKFRMEKSLSVKILRNKKSKVPMPLEDFETDNLSIFE